VTTTVEALYEDGKLILRQRLPLPDKSQVLVTVESDTERAAWLRVSEQALTETWDNHPDDVFDDLLKE
jgi:predicted DNA-binding antitoxin AbrB/MazE fold protein